MERTRLPILTLAAFALLSGCRTAPTRLAEQEIPPPLPPQLALFAEPGPHSYTRITASIRSETGCEVAFTEYRPQTGGSAGGADADRTPAVILAHGFLRTQQNMRGWAQLFSSHGVRTVTVSFCNSSLFNGNHAQNAADLRLVADAVATRQTPLIYAGYSAGGLSAALAAAHDERTVGYLGIDPVDSGALMETVEALPGPAFSLLGEPNPCNREGTTRQVLPAGNPSWLIEVRFATHCTFEDPTDNRCRNLCGSLLPVEADERLRAVIQSLGTSFVVAQFGADPRAMGTISAESLTRFEAAGYIRIIDPLAQPGI